MESGSQNHITMAGTEMESGSWDHMTQECRNKSFLGLSPPRAKAKWAVDPTFARPRN
jgi:hypothetical protein